MIRLTEGEGKQAKIIGVDVQKKVQGDPKIEYGIALLFDDRYQDAVARFAEYEKLGFTPEEFAALGYTLNELKSLASWATKLAALSAGAKKLNLEPPIPVVTPPVADVPAAIADSSSPSVAVENSPPPQLAIANLGLNSLVNTLLERNGITTIDILASKTVQELKDLTFSTPYASVPDAFVFEISNALGTRFGIELAGQETSELIPVAEKNKKLY